MGSRTLLQLYERAWDLLFRARICASCERRGAFSCSAGYPAVLLCWARVCYANACHSDHPNSNGFLTDLAAVLCVICDGLCPMKVQTWAFILLIGLIADSDSVIIA